MSATNESPSVAVERAIEILEALANRDGGMTNSEISRRVGIPKSSASYILRTLEKRGYLRRERDTGKYKLGLKVLSLSRSAQTSLGIRDLALPILRRLVDRTGLTAHLAVLDDGEAVYLEKAESPSLIRIDTWVGRRLDIHSTAVGKALVAFLPRADIEAMINQRGLKKRTPKTISTHVKFFREVWKVQDQGYAIDDEENSLGSRCVAAPVIDALGKPVAAVGVGGTTGQMDRVALTRATKAVREAAKEIAEQVGHRRQTNGAKR